MTQQDQYNKDAEALAGTGKEPWTLWQVWKDLANGVGWYACTRKPDFNDPDMKYYRGKTQTPLSCNGSTRKTWQSPVRPKRGLTDGMKWWGGRGLCR